MINSFPPLASLFFPTFQEIQGCIIRHSASGSVASINIDFGSSIAQIENMENHHHFDYVLGRTPLERWRENLVLARAVRICWLDRLAVQFPGVRFQAPIHNELVIGEGRAGAMATLRLWTDSGDPDHSMARVFAVEEEDLDLIATGESELRPFLHWAEIFTKSGTLRTQFVRMILRKDAS